jgi:hypothetical protein
MKRYFDYYDRPTLYALWIMFGLGLGTHIPVVGGWLAVVAFFLLVAATARSLR